MPEVNIVPHLNAIQYAADGSNAAEIVAYMESWAAANAGYVEGGLTMTVTMNGSTIHMVCSPTWLGISMDLEPGDWVVRQGGNWGRVSEVDFPTQYVVLP